MAGNVLKWLNVSVYGWIGLKLIFFLNDRKLLGKSGNIWKCQDMSRIGWKCMEMIMKMTMTIMMMMMMKKKKNQMGWPYENCDGPLF